MLTNIGANGALNEGPYRGRFRVSLLTDGSKARRDGTNLRLADVLARFTANWRTAKADSMNRPRTQFGLAFVGGMCIFYE